MDERSTAAPVRSWQWDEVPRQRVGPAPRGRHAAPTSARGRGALVVATGLLALGSGTAAAGVGHASASAAPAAEAAAASAPGAAFAATPYLLPLELRVRVAHRSPSLPPATAPLVALPSDLRAAAADIPRTALAAYARAARTADRRHPGCDLPWQLVAAIGYVESGHARSGGSAAATWDGVARPPILGPVLDGAPGLGAISDTDDGRLDGDAHWDRAVGPMQFIPSTWARYAADGDDDGERDPQSIWDAATATGDYLCTAATGLGEPANQIPAVFAYNHSFDYVRAVLTVAASYLGIDPALLGVDSLPHDAAPSPTPAPTPSAVPPAPASRARPQLSEAPAGPPTPRPVGTGTPAASPPASPAASSSPPATVGPTAEPSPSPSAG